MFINLIRHTKSEPYLYLDIKASFKTRFPKLFFIIKQIVNVCNKAFYYLGEKISHSYSMLNLKSVGLNILG